MFGLILSAVELSRAIAAIEAVFGATAALLVVVYGCYRIVRAYRGTK